MQRIIFLALWLVACTTPESPSVPQPAAGTGVAAFVGVNLIPMSHEGGVLAGQTVLIREGRIDQIGPQDTVAIPAGALRIEGAGHYLLPGLTDMHVHLEYFEDPALLRLFLDHGVTTVRNMDGRPYILEWREKIATGEITSPSIITAGPLLDGDPPLRDDNTVVRNAAEARRIVAEQRAAGYDFVKVYTNLSREAWEAILQQAKIEGLPVVGHVPRRVNLAEALARSMASIEHLDGYDDLIEADDSPYRNRWHWAKMFLAMPADPAKIRAAAARTATTGVWNVPTLVQKEKTGTVAEMTAWLHRPEIQGLPPIFREAWDPAGWDEDRRRPYESIDEEDRALLAQGRRQRLALVKALHEGGAGVLIGTDTPNPFVVPGLSAIEEIQLFVEAGLTPEQALAAATREAARFLGHEKEFGTIAPGLRADLVLLEANPLEDISRLHRRIGVMARGRWYLSAAQSYHATPGVDRK